MSQKFELHGLSFGGRPGAQSRRRFVGTLLSTAVVPSLAFARPQDLLDPSRVGAPRPQQAPTGNSGLLDPATVRASRVASTTDLDTPTDRTSTSVARNMAVSVSGAVRGLISSATTKVDQCVRLKRSEEDLTNRLARSEREKQSKLDEYRQGLFCGGCGKTRSEILAVETTFPHPGQSITRATPAQIAAKEVELDGQIARLVADLETARSARAAAEPSRDEALDQIGFGVELWRSAVGFERRINELNEEDAEARYRIERTSARSQATRLMAQPRPSDTREALIQRLAQLESLAAIMRQLDQRREAGKLRHRERIVSADAYARRERDALVRAGMEASAAMQDLLSSTSVRNSVSRLIGNDYMRHGSTPAVQGRPFRMGDAEPAKRGTVLPAVDRFLAQFNSEVQPITFSMPPEPDLNLMSVDSAILTLRRAVSAPPITEPG